MPEPPNLDPPDTPERRLDKLEARLGRLDATDEKVAALEARLGQLDETDEKIGRIEGRLEKMAERPPPVEVETPPHPAAPRRLAPAPAPAADAEPVWFYPPDLTKRDKRRRG